MQSVGTRLGRTALALCTAVMVLTVTLGVASSASAAPKHVRLAYFSFATANTLAAAQQQAIEQVAQKDNASVKVFDAQGDAMTQLNQVETAATSGEFDAFIIFPVDGNSLQSGVKLAIANHIKVVAIFATIGPNPNSLKPQVPGLTSTVATEVSDSGIRIGQMAVQACKGRNPCQVAYMPGLATYYPEAQRQKAFEAVIKKSSNIKLVATQDGMYSPDAARSAAENILQANPNLNVFATSGDQMTIGVAQAVADAGKSGQISLIGDGASTTAIQAIQAGKWFGSYVILPKTEATLGAEYAISAARGKKVPEFTRSITLSPIGPVAVKGSIAHFKGQWG